MAGGRVTGYNPLMTEAVPPAPSRSLPWVFLLTLALVAGLAELAFVVVNVSSLPVFLKDGLGKPALSGVAMGTFYLFQALGNSPMGHLADRFGRRRLMVLGSLLSVATCLGTATIRFPEGGSLVLPVIELLILRAIDGIGAAMFWPAVFAAIGDKICAERQAQAMTVLNGTYFAGIAVGPLIGGLMNDTLAGGLAASDPHRYAPSFYLAAGCFLLCAILSYAVAPRRGEGQHAPVAHEEAHAGAASVAAVLRACKRVPWLMLMGFLIFLVVGVISPYAKPYFMDRFQMSETQFGSVLLVPALFIGAISVPLGKVSDKWGKTRSIRLGLGVCCLSLWGILVVTSPPMVMLLGGLLGVGFAVAFPSYMAHLGELAAPGERGSLIGAVQMAQGIGALCGAGLGASLQARSDGNHVAFLISGVVLTLGFVMSLFFVREPEAIIAP